MTTSLKVNDKPPVSALPSDRVAMIDLLTDLSERIAKGKIDHIVVTVLGRHDGSMMASMGTRSIPIDTVIGAVQIGLTRLVNETIEVQTRRASPIIQPVNFSTMGKPQ